jgi:hypothetical protein
MSTAGRKADISVVTAEMIRRRIVETSFSRGDSQAKLPQAIM